MAKLLLKKIKNIYNFIAGDAKANRIGIDLMEKRIPNKATKKRKRRKPKEIKKSPAKPGIKGR